jgi:phage-related protein
MGDKGEKKIVWLHGEVKTPPFSSEARKEAGFCLRLLQKGERLGMPASRPLPEISAKCHELRITDSRRLWRIVYYVNAEAVVILEVFDKETRSIPGHIVETCKKRLQRFREDKSRFDS